MKLIFLSRLYLVTLSLITLLNLEQSIHGWLHVDPTEGFISLPLNQSNFVVQWPFNVPQEQRYSFVNGTHKLWVYSTDKPHSPTSHTRPRTEIRIHDHVADPTHGFIAIPLNTSNFHIQKPYDLPLSSRYSFTNEVHKIWVFSIDNPLTKGSPTKPRTEIFIQGYDYSSGVWQFEAFGYVPHGTSGVCIMQVFGASQHATTLMLRVYNGSLTYYQSPVLVPNIYNRWFRVNVVHDVEGSNVKVYVNRVLVYEAPGRGGTSHYFKCGVYAQNDDSYLMESYWKRIKVLKKRD